MCDFHFAASVRTFNAWSVAGNSTKGDLVPLISAGIKHDFKLEPANRDRIPREYNEEPNGTGRCWNSLSVISEPHGGLKRRDPQLAFSFSLEWAASNRESFTEGSSVMLSRNFADGRTWSDSRCSATRRVSAS